MKKPLLHLLTSVHPGLLFVALTLVKGMVFLTLVPAVERSVGPYYGIGFADNYHLLAENLSEGAGYRFHSDTGPTLMREPGYPMFLAALFHLFGRDLAVARAANLLLSLITVGIIARLSLELSKSELAARIAPVLYMIHPGIVVAELRGGVEILFITLLMSFLATIFWALRGSRLSRYFVAGLVLGATSLVRSTALLFPMFLFVYFFVWERPRSSVVVMGSRIGAIFAAALIVLSPWIVRNYVLVGQFVPTASVQGVAAQAGQYICRNLSLHNGVQELDTEAAKIRSSLARSQGYRFRDGYYQEFFDPRDEVAFNSELTRQVLSGYRESPALIFQCVAKNTFNFWFSGKNWTATWINMAVQLPYLAIAIAGLFIGLRGPLAPKFGLLLLFVLYTMGTYLPIHAQARYSIPLVPVLSMLAAIAMSSWFSLPLQTAPRSY